MQDIVIGSDYSRHPIPGQTAMNLRAVGEQSVFPHAPSCECSECRAKACALCGYTDCDLDCEA